jgi:hypothetical protein
MSEDIWAVELGRGMGPLELGAERGEVLRRLAEAGMEQEDDEDDWLWVEEMDAELNFKTTKPQTLYEIVIEDDRPHFGSQVVIGRRVHEIVELLQIPDSETLWRLEGNNVRQQAAAREDVPANDKELLSRGTLWIAALGLGLSMVDGEIDTLRLRKPEDAPRRGLGTLSSAQRELSKRNDLDEYLATPVAGERRRGRWYQGWLTVALALALGLLVARAFDYQRRWNEAPVVEGEVIAVNPPPPDPFPSELTVAYRDQAGGEHQTVFRLADVYATRAVGEKVEVRYLPSAPEEPMGPAQYRDAGFVKYLPWGIGLMGVYCVLQVVGSLVGMVGRRSAL